MKKTLIISILFSGLLFIFSPSLTFAACPPEIFDVQCAACGGRDGANCAKTPGLIPQCKCGDTSDPGFNTSKKIGNVDNPFPQTAIGPFSGVTTLITNVIRLVFVLAGIFAFVKLIISGIQFINAGGEPKEFEKAWEGIWKSLLGLVIIISSLAVAALLGQLLLGDPTAILNPKIYTP